ncbi:hypothetical protein DICPUDRAFT_93737 [Dictyostelium purpureum]|uniref:Phosphoribosyltransferase domain-containing protein n=1 Tax=Dictyostelium purpureum TaxID=5786 RepID=F0ZB16_DICPU|nr:uncharacterized protein DICPUDRAFT_93737 [Dictyostelium purpureum]EGC38814.1 hypothetical protein DICPUDRAFT_93737 [Dictyostelium purpureum]|eukprot:XP_003284608.1 hypothetical protein DICPUDRAFT_93737 [Dictyostelium purpureum]
MFKKMIKVASKTPVVFKDREDAGSQLLNFIKKEFKESEITPEKMLIVALPRGGVPVAYPISSALKLPLDLATPRKIGAPGHEEYAIGAVAEQGEAFINEECKSFLSFNKNAINQEIEKQKEESKRRQQVYKKNRKPIDYQNKTIIIVDDGIATGSTMRAAINSIHTKNPKKIVIAVPTAPMDSLEEIAKIDKVNEILCISTPRDFMAVGCFYDTFDQTNDETVIELLEKSIN